LNPIAFGRVGKPKHRHAYPTLIGPDGITRGPCACGQPFDPGAARRSRTSRRAGKDAERHIAKAYGGTRTGQYGGPDDVLAGRFVIQSKAGGWFSERYWNELVKLPRTGGRVPTLIVADRPRPGVHARRMVIRMMSDDVDLHGE
jgi:hypothetical protein